MKNPNAARALLPKLLEETILIRTIFELQTTFELCKKKELMVHSQLSTNTEIYPICFWGVLELPKDRIFTKGHYFRQYYWYCYDYHYYCCCYCYYYC